MKHFLIAVLFLAAVPGWAAEVYTLSLLPESGTIAGGPGQTVGWGYSIENQSTTHWLVTSGLAPSSFQFGTPELLFDFPILAPGSSVSTPFDAGTSTGLLTLTWDASAPLGSVESGIFLVSAEWWIGDPLAGGQFAFAASPLSQSYQATVVPDPGTAALVGLALLVAGVRRRWRQGS